jgi:hypothetical protein
MIINRIYEHQNLLLLWLVTSLVGLRTYQHPCRFQVLRTPSNSKWHWRVVTNQIHVAQPMLRTILSYRRNEFHLIQGWHILKKFKGQLQIQVTAWWHKVRSILSRHNIEMNQKPLVSVTICLVHVNLYPLLYIKKLQEICWKYWAPPYKTSPAATPGLMNAKVWWKCLKYIWCRFITWDKSIPHPTIVLTSNIFSCYLPLHLPQDPFSSSFNTRTLYALQIYPTIVSFPAYIILNFTILTPHAICGHSQHRTLGFKHNPTGKVTFPYILILCFLRRQEIQNRWFVKILQI